MKKYGLFLGIILLFLTGVMMGQKTTIYANEKFEGKESEFLEKCAQRLNAEEAQECSEFKEYYTNKGEKLKNSATELQSEIDSLKENIDQLLEKTKTLEIQIKQLQSERAIIENNIQVSEQNIIDIQSDIEEVRKRIEKRIAEVKKRMQDDQLFVTGNRKFEFLLESENFADLLRRISIMDQISQYDQERITLLKKDQEVLKDNERELVRQKDSLVAQRNEIKNKEEATALLSKTNQELVAVYLGKKAAIEEKQREAETDYATIVSNASSINTTASIKEIQSIVEQNNPSEPIAGNSAFGMPLSGSWEISAGTWHYPADFGGGTHLGLDFAGHQGIGQPVLAVANSLVLMTKTGCGDVGGLGNYCGSPIAGGGNWVVLLTEVNGEVYSFYYYHLTSSGVTTKRTVSKGEVIGHMGSSGNSTGPHTHVEVIYHGAIGLQKAYDNFVASGYQPAFGLPWNVNSSCANRSTPCRLRPETIFGV